MNNLDISTQFALSYNKDVKTHELKCTDFIYLHILLVAYKWFKFIAVNIILL